MPNNFGGDQNDPDYRVVSMQKKQTPRMKYTPLTRAAAIKLLKEALEYAKRGEEDPVIVAGVERNISLGGKVWALAWHARVEVARRHRKQGLHLRHENTIGLAITILENGWEPEA